MSLQSTTVIVLLMIWSLEFDCLKTSLDFLLSLVWVYDKVAAGGFSLRKSSSERPKAFEKKFSPIIITYYYYYKRCRGGQGKK